jgi:hypothetical protein
MAPIHDTDLAEERWSQGEWEHYELWEKIEIRLRRKKLLWIGLTLLVFLAISSIPIILDRAPKWAALALTRRLSEEIISLKRESAVIKQALRIRFRPASLDFVIEKSSRCADSHWARLREGTLALRSGQSDSYSVMTSQQGSEFDVPGLVQNFCYDPLSGSDTAQKTGEVAGFGVIPVKDLAEKRSDRMSLLILSGASAEISFE